VVTGGSFFSWGTKFRYSGRTEREIQEDIGPLRRDEPPIKRTSSLRRKASSVPATPSTPVGTELGEISKNKTNRKQTSFLTAFCPQDMEVYLEPITLLLSQIQDWMVVVSSVE
jgi:hypothetical protein